MTRTTRHVARTEAGLTLIELLIGMLLSSMLVGFILAAYAKGSAALRAQNRVSDTQQGLRAVHNVLVREVRMAGLNANTFRTQAGGSQTSFYPAVMVDNDAAGAYGSDVLRIFYGDPTTLAPVTELSGQFISSMTSARVDSTGGFAVGDLAIATRTAGATIGQGCVVEVTVVAAGPPARLHYTTKTPWNTSTNQHCANPPGDPFLNTVWDDGDTMFVKFVPLAYRIKPSDAAGVLQMSPSGGFVAGDWQDLAIGFVDLQVALRIFEEASTTDRDGDGDPQRNWYSDDNMETISYSNTAGSQVQLLQVRLTLLARSSTEVDATQLTQTPAIWNPAMPVAHNDMSDQPPFPLNGSEPLPYRGDYIYRTVSTYIDMRNMGLGL